MAQVDDFLRGLVAPGLEHGESVLGVALLRRPRNVNALGIAERYEERLAVATDRRLVVFESEIEEFLKAKPKALAVAKNPREWRYDELQAVRVAPVQSVVFETRGSATAITLIPHVGCGPFAEEEEPGRTHGQHKRYDLFEEIGGVDGQAAMYRDFPQWLAPRVAAGAFPLSPQRRAAIEARAAQRHAHGLALDGERAKKRKAAWGDGVAVLIVAFSLAVASFGGFLLKGGLGGLGKAEAEASSLEKEIAVRESDLATWVRNPKLLPPEDCPDKQWVIRPGEGSARDACHMCREFSRDKGAAPPPPHFRTFERGGKSWACPDAGSYESALARARAALRSAEESASRAQTKLTLGIVLIVVGLGVLAGGFGLRSWRKKRVAAASTP